MIMEFDLILEIYWPLGDTSYTALFKTYAKHKLANYEAFLAIFH